MFSLDRSAYTFNFPSLAADEKNEIDTIYMSQMEEARAYAIANAEAYIETSLGLAMVGYSYDMDEETEFYLGSGYYTYT